MTERSDQKLRESLIRIEESLAQVRRDVAEMKEDQKQNYVTRYEFMNTRKDVDDILDNNKWLIRLVMGAVVTAIMGLILVIQ